MAIYYVDGTNGSDANAGTSYALAKATLNAVEDLPVVGGDLVYVAPGTYREMLTVDVDGDNSYTTGTVSVTNGSATVTGSGTTFTGGNVDDTASAGAMFLVSHFESETDGVTNGTTTFTSAAGDFQANMVGEIIEIMTKGAYQISAVGSTTSITLSDVNGLGNPSAGSGLTYYVRSGVGPYAVSSVDSATQLTLAEPWTGPTLTGLSYETWRPITYVGDNTGDNTDGVGGHVRITGSDNDSTLTRSFCISATAMDYRTFRGLTLDMADGWCVHSFSCTRFIVEDCTMYGCSTAAIKISGVLQGTNTVRRCKSNANKYYGIWITHSAAVDNPAHHFENCDFQEEHPLRSDRIGGTYVKNYAMNNNFYGVRVWTAVNVGQTITVRNSPINSAAGAGLQGTTAGQITEDYNNFYQNEADRTNVATGSNSTTHAPGYNPPLLKKGYVFPWWFGELAPWSALKQLTGSNQPYDDLFGIARPATAAKLSWGPIQFMDASRETTTTFGGSTASLKLADAGEALLKIVAVKAVSTTISVHVQREADYAGTAPTLIVREPGQADVTATDTGAVSAWNKLSVTFTPQAANDYVYVYLKSENTAVAGSYAVYADHLRVA